MPMFSRILAVILLSVAASTSPAAAAVALRVPSRVTGQPGGCHSGHQTPSHDPAPVSYQCCAAGHDVALLASGLVLHPPAVVATKIEIDASATAPTAPAYLISLPDRPSPPGLTSLRI
jgi:hypothetical protein